MSLADVFLRQAKRLADEAQSQIDLRRAVSNAYYAVFHELCSMAAEMVVGDGNDLKRAWLQAYRSLDHKPLKNRLLKVWKFSELSDEKKEKRQADNTDLNFPSEVTDVADSFASLQNERHEADYNPQQRFNREEVVLSIGSAQQCLVNLRRLEEKHKKALVTFICLQDRRAT